jgi:multidrug efflux pump subunit AcrB
VTRGASRDAGSHIADVVVELTESEERDVTSTELATRWRAMVGNIPEAISFTFLSSAGGHRVGGKPIDIALLGEDMADLRTASAMLKDALGKYQGVEDVEDSYRPGKQELRFTLKPGARQLGITLADLARQIRANFWGEEALKIQRGKNEVTIRVRYPSDERETRGDVERMRVRAPDNGEIPFSQVAEVEEYRGPSNIHRMYGRRSIRVSADVDEEVANAACPK